jgi:hypothetical protein
MVGMGIALMLTSEDWLRTVKYTAACHLDAGDSARAVETMLWDLRRHPETQAVWLAAAAARPAGSFASVHEARAWINQQLGDPPVRAIPAALFGECCEICRSVVVRIQTARRVRGWVPLGVATVVAFVAVMVVSATARALVLGFGLCSVAIYSVLLWEWLSEYSPSGRRLVWYAADRIRHRRERWALKWYVARTRVTRGVGRSLQWLAARSPH